MGWLVRLWPIWVLACVLVLWRLWHLRAKGEGDPDSTAAERKRWKRTLIGLVAIALLGVVATALESRPQSGVYHPLEWSPDGGLHGATIENDKN